MPNTRKSGVVSRTIPGRITIEQVLNYYRALGTLERSGCTLTGTCPIGCAGVSSGFCADTTLNAWICTNCKRGGGPVEFFSIKEQLSKSEAARLLGLLLSKGILEG